MPGPVLVKQVPPAVQVYPSLWGNRRFLLLLSSYSISLFGNTFHSIALSLWVLQTTAAPR